MDFGAEGVRRSNRQSLAGGLPRASRLDILSTWSPF